MAAYHEELLEAAKRLHSRRTGQKGKLPAARIRRSISTSYYAIFHFLLAEIGAKVVGSTAPLLRRRRIIARTVSHRALRTMLDKVRGAQVDSSVAEFLCPGGVAASRRRGGRRGRDAAVRAQSGKRIRGGAGTADRCRLRSQQAVERARCASAEGSRQAGRAGWQAATDPRDRDFKHALCVLVLLKGQLRSDN